MYPCVSILPYLGVKIYTKITIYVYGYPLIAINNKVISIYRKKKTCPTDYTGQVIYMSSTYSISMSRVCAVTASPNDTMICFTVPA